MLCQRGVSCFQNISTEVGVLTSQPILLSNTTLYQQEAIAGRYIPAVGVVNERNELRKSQEIKHSHFCLYLLSF